jgi:hypothetical protein
LAGHFGGSDAGEAATLGAFERALPDWTPIVARGRPPLALREALRADATVLAGWSIGCAGEGPPGLVGGAALIAAAKLRRHPTALLGISAREVGEVPWGPRLCRWLLGGADLVVLRDQASARHLEAAGVRGPFRIGAGPAWLDVHGRRRLDGSGERRVVVAIESRSCPPGQVARLGEALAAIARDGVEIGLQPWPGPEADGAVHRVAVDLAGRIGEPVRMLRPLPDLGAGREALAGAGAVVALGTQALTAAAGTAAAVAVACEPEIADLAARLHLPLIAPCASAAEIAEAIADAIEREPPRPNPVEGQIATAEEGFRLLRVLLAEGRGSEVEELSGLPLWGSEE